ncbi:hypothetical protein [Primorskyibacter marinus]|uniref:hypothetical protein n=1 Tax=Primorskyibacter marinus TaxID=1977320 RepID=UPI000E3087AB|nr:hypothetical protein [Primorskyibacter marinus]
MKLIPLALILSVCMTPAVATAQETAPETEEAPSLMERGARLFMRGLMEEMGPTLKELEGLAQDVSPAMKNFARNMGPALRDLMTEIEDWSVYDAPEILPNGDILIRRKPDAAPMDRPLKDGEIEL